MTTDKTELKNMLLLSAFSLLLILSNIHADAFDDQVQTWDDQGYTGYIDINIILYAAVFIAVATALAYAIGNTFGLQQLTEAAKSELMQSAVTVFMAVTIIALLAVVNVALDKIAEDMASPCVAVSMPASLVDAPLIYQYSYCYSDNLYQLSLLSAEQVLSDAVEASNRAYRSRGVMTERWWFLYSGFYMRPEAHMRLQSEVKGQEFRMLQGIIISLAGQRHFLLNILPVVAPISIFLGILMRGLFYTRRFGGLLMAIGLGLLLVWPSTYLLSWLSLKVGVYGQQSEFEDPESTCPDSCRIQPPIGYKTSNDGSRMFEDTLNLQEVINALEVANKSADPTNVTVLLNLNIQTCTPAEGTTPGTGAVNPIDSKNCPLSCRILPTPLECNQTACDNLPNACRVIREMNMSDIDGDNCIDNTDWPCDEASCPEYCKMALPEVRYEGGGYKFSENRGRDVVPSPQGGNCSDDADCVACDTYFKRYTLGADDNFTMNDVPECESCMQDHPDCMMGIPALLSKTCDDSTACGARMDLAKYINNPVQGVCPIDCRIIDETFPDAYKDATYVKYCEQSPEIAQACNKCPDECKINATESLGAGDKIVFDEIGGQNLDYDIVCEEAPTFSGDPPKMDEDVNGKCARCPLSCRLVDPDSIKDPNKPGEIQFMSGAHYSLPCYYIQPHDTNIEECTISINYSGPRTCNMHGLYPDDWRGLDHPNPIEFSNCPSDIQDQMGLPPECAPTAKVQYIAEGPSSPACPRFLADTAPYMTAKLRFDLDPDDNPINVVSQTPGFNPDPPHYYLSLYVPDTTVTLMAPSPDISGECTDPEVIEFCTGTDPDTGRPYCPDSCKVNRTDAGPYYCMVEDITDAYSEIMQAEYYCDECYENPGDNTKGAQCQVMLYHDGSMIDKPRGCSDSCIYDSLDPVPYNQQVRAGVNLPCNGFCYPRLEIPSPSSPSNCADYVDVNPRNSDISAPTQDNREFEDCAACPVDCRYDFKIAGGVKKTDVAREECGDTTNGFRACKPECNYRVIDHSNKLESCEADYWDCDTEYTSCTRHSDGWHWLRNGGWGSSSYSICKSWDYFDNETHAQDNGYFNSSVWSNPTIYSCSMPNPKYPNLQQMLNDAGAIDSNGNRYYECGDLTASGDNPERNLCGSKNIGGRQITFCKNNANAADTCFAHYNSLKVACLQTEDLKEVPVHPSATDPVEPDEGCQHCPLFCRIEGGESTSACPTDPWLGGGNTPECSSPNQCDTDKSTSTVPPGGFCGIPISEFKLEETGDGNCATPKRGYGSACPARCRIIIDNFGTLPLDCTGGDIGDSCVDMIDYCKAGTPSKLCADCIDCQKDCLYLPYVRTNCEELCLPSDMELGGTDMSVASMLSKWGGAFGNPAWRSIGQLSLAGYLLPIFSIILTIAFIRTLSPILGGDIEIPGLMKLI